MIREHGLPSPIAFELQLPLALVRSLIEDAVTPGGGPPLLRGIIDVLSIIVLICRVKVQLPLFEPMEDGITLLDIKQLILLPKFLIVALVDLVYRFLVRQVDTEVQVTEKELVVMTLDHVVLELLAAVERPLPDLPDVFEPLPDFFLPTGEVAVQEGKASIIIVESNGYTALVASLATQPGLDLGCANVVDVVLELVPCEYQDKATDHGLLPEVHISVTLAEGPGDYFLPKVDFLSVFTLHDRFGIQLYHLLQADYKYVRKGLAIFRNQKVSDVEVLSRVLSRNVPGEYLQLEVPPLSKVLSILI